MIDRRLVRNFDLRLFIVLIILCLVGLLTLYSATTAGGGGIPSIL